MQEPFNRISSKLICEGGYNQKPGTDSNQEAQRDKLVGQNPGDQGGVQGVQEFEEFKEKEPGARIPESGDAFLWRQRQRA